MIITQVFRWLIFTAILAAVLVAVFVAWWLVLIIVLALMAVSALRRLFGAKPADRATGEAVILEGEYTEVEREASRKLPDRGGPGA